MTNFYLDARPDKRGDHPIRVSTRATDGRLLTSIGYGIAADKWDATAGRVMPGTAKNPTTNARGVPAATINARIAAIRADFAALEAAPAPLTLAVLRAHLAAIVGRTERTQQGCPEVGEVLASLATFIREESRAQQWAPGTLKVWDAFALHLRCFKKDLRFSDFDAAGLAAFISYLRTRGISAPRQARAGEAKARAEEAARTAETPAAAAAASEELERAGRILESTEPEGLTEKTAAKHYGNLRWFLRWAIRRGDCTEKAVETFRPKFKVIAPPVVFLTRPQLLKLYSFQIPANGTELTLTDYAGSEYKKKVEDAGALAKTRDLFCFCAFTSLRYSDMAALKRTDIKDDAITITTQKTNDRLTIPLNNYSRAILDKYKGLHDPRGLALPVISNQKMNDYLKDLCEICGFNEPVTRIFWRGGGRVEETAPKWSLMGTHAGRRTFICNALTIGIPPQVVMKFTGHSDYAAMKPYIAIAETDAAKAMQLLND